MNDPLYVHLYLAELFLESEIFRTKAVENIKAHILRIITFHENRAVCEIMWKNVVQPTQAIDNEILRMLFACWITKAAYVILNRFYTATVVRTRHGVDVIRLVDVCL